MTTKFVKIHEVMNACVILSQKSGAAVRTVQSNGSLNIMQKGLSKMDIVTEADLRIQKTI